MALNGKVVFSSGWSSDYDIWTLNLEEGGLNRLTFGKDFNQTPAWSPDGKKIAYISTQEDSIPSLWVMNELGADKKRLTTKSYCQTPSWSPDGKTIIFSSNAADANEIEICTIPAEGGTPTKLFSYKGIEEKPSFSPDGKKVVFSAQTYGKEGSNERRDSDIVEYDIAMQSFKVLCKHPAKDYAPVYSPDGSKIAFVSHRNNRSAEEYKERYAAFKDLIINGSNAEARAALRDLKKFEADGDIFVMNSDGSGIKQLTDNSSIDNGICWSPCGNFLMYTGCPASNTETERLKVLDANSGKSVSFDYDRTEFEKEIGMFQELNRSVFQRMLPDFIERQFVNQAFWGEERHPHWVKC